MSEILRVKRTGVTGTGRYEALKYRDIPDGYFLKRSGNEIVGAMPPAGAAQIVPAGAPAFPVGAGFISFVPTNPATLLGYGVWVQVAQGRALVGVDAGDPDFDAAEKITGSKLTRISAHAGTAVEDHAAHTHTYTQVPNHVHGLTSVLRTATTGAATTQVAQATDTSSTSDTTRKTDNPVGGVSQGTTAGPSTALTHSVTQPSDHADLSVVQPSFAIYVWKRTA